jgi:hypothetical protein
MVVSWAMTFSMGTPVNDARIIHVADNAGGEYGDRLGRSGWWLLWWAVAWLPERVLDRLDTFGVQRGQARQGPLVTQKPPSRLVVHPWECQAGLAHSEPMPSACSGAICSKWAKWPWSRRSDSRTFARSMRPSAS